jgi:DNA-3-methyladenine glycosylase II
MAFPVEDAWVTAGVCVREADGAIVGAAFGDVEDLDLDTVRQQTARILSLDVDGRAFPDIGRRDPIAGEIQQRYPGLRPVCFYSPYEAAAWAIISHRINRHQAVAVKTRLAEAFGARVDIHRQAMRAFPSPERLLSLAEFPGLPSRKVDNLRAVAQAALAGRLDAASLRALPEEQALARLQELPGIGPFGAQLILLRGAAHPDCLTLIEPRFRRALGQAYALPGQPTDADLRRLSEPWRPYRTWMTFLLRQAA